MSSAGVPPAPPTPQEIGIRMALGTGHREILRMVLRHGLGLVGAGLIVGLGLSLVLAEAIAGILYNVPATDPLTFAAVVVVLLAVAAIACIAPARCATGISPVVALRAN